MVVECKRCTHQNQHAVAGLVLDGAAASRGGGADGVVVLAQDLDHALRRGRRRKGGEAAQVATHHRELDGLLVGRALQTAPAHHLRDLRREKARHELRAPPLGHVILDRADQQDHQPEYSRQRRHRARQKDRGGHERRSQGEGNAAQGLRVIGAAIQHQRHRRAAAQHRKRNRHGEHPEHRFGQSIAQHWHVGELQRMLDRQERRQDAVEQHQPLRGAHQPITASRVEGAGRNGAPHAQKPFKGEDARQHLRQDKNAMPGGNTMTRAVGHGNQHVERDRRAQARQKQRQHAAGRRIAISDKKRQGHAHRCQADNEGGQVLRHHDGILCRSRMAGRTSETSRPGICRQSKAPAIPAGCRPTSPPCPT